MENYKSVKKKGSAKLMHSIGFKVGIIISILLLLILGVKATSDIITQQLLQKTREISLKKPEG